jgi:thiol-disulfide isomerase/thioredoxin
MTNVFRKYFVVLVFMFCNLSFTSCGSDSSETEDLVGKFTWTEWQKKAGWKDYSASDYTPNAIVTDSLKKIIHFDEISFVIFASNWCHQDCEPQVPRIMKLLKEIGYEQNNIVIYGLNRTKKEPAIPISQYKILYVPTLVIIKNGEEIGKIVESPAESWEKNILEIVTN